ncbi:rubrerythrin family protein [Halovenus marina]|uniref:rubrerythrin family protein n=1 Tax=Halovenus marina TaxID=3396621 RepID=UPI003F556B39
MDSTAVLDAVNANLRTELSRLGSSKLLYALTEGDMEEAPVLTALATRAHHAAAVLDAWGDKGGAGAVFSDAADVVNDQYDEIRTVLSEHDPGERPQMIEAMSEFEGVEQRLGAVLGWTLVAERTASQASGFFTGQADPGTASTFRAFGDEYERLRSEAAEALDDVCADEDDYERATAAASAAVEAAYDEYVETLESLGVNPKPVC